MWSSRDIAYVVMFAALSVVNLATIIQFFSQFFIVIPGIGYAVDVLGPIFGGVAFLLYRGKRWRILVQGILIALLTLPLYLGPVPPGDIIFRIPIIIKALLVDLIFNSFYASFERKNKLYHLTILQLLFFFSVGPFIDMLFSSLFIPFELLWLTYYYVILMLPLIIVLTIIGGSIGYKIYKRLEKITYIQS